MPPTTPLRRRLAAAAAAAALALATACTDSTGDNGPDGEGGPDQVVYWTAFGASAHDSFIFVADEKGFFEENNLEVEISLGSGSQNFAPLIADEIQFTYIDVTGVLRGIGAGELQEDDFVLLNAVHHTTLAAILVPESMADVQAPADLTGKTLGAFAGSPTDFLLPAYAELSGWEYDDDLLTRAGGPELFQLYAAGNFEVISTFIIQKGLVENVIGEPTRAFPFNEYLGDLLGTGLITSRQVAEADPDLVMRFRDAAIEGLKYTLANPEEAIEIMQARHPDAINPEQIPAFVAQIRIMDPYVTGEGEDRIGVIDPARLERTVSALVEHGLIPNEIPADALVQQVTLTTVS